MLITLKTSVCLCHFQTIEWNRIMVDLLLAINVICGVIGPYSCFNWKSNSGLNIACYQYTDNSKMMLTNEYVESDFKLCNLFATDNKSIASPLHSSRGICLPQQPLLWQRLCLIDTCTKILALVNPAQCATLLPNTKFDF